MILPVSLLMELDDEKLDEADELLKDDEFLEDVEMAEDEDKLLEDELTTTGELLALDEERKLLLNCVLDELRTGAELELSLRELSTPPQAVSARESRPTAAA